MATAEAKHVQSVRKNEIDRLASLAHNPLLTRNDIPWEDKVRFFEQEAQSAGYKAFVLADRTGSGRTLTSDGDIVQVENETFYRQALQGQANVSDVIIRQSETDMIFAVPVIENEQITGVFMGSMMVCSSVL